MDVDLNGELWEVTGGFPESKTPCGVESLLA